MDQEDFDYKGFRFVRTEEGWWAILPSGLRKRVSDQTPEDIRAAIDALGVGQ
jgi:hypothetical protein